ncbi:Sec-independent protein translocase protein TatB [Parahaliea mediterranea]|uniref:Sec-independent protein translocase protein TatB n=1 Tax=Parahaliea mediterranea TaxID=651086 RepID=A0A939DGT7_9GAMM|nr:twin-arginine translocase subunit TatB [Parahaliea mediterranea]
MFDIGFLELVIIAAVALLVIGPERLPGAVRTGALYFRRIKRGFNDIRQEVEQELHNDAVMQELKKTRDQVSDQTGQWRDDISRAGEQFERDLRLEDDTPAPPPAEPPEKPRE